MTRLITALVVLALISSVGLAAAAEPRTAPSETIAGEFVRRLPVGTNVQVRMEDGAKIKGLLMGIEDGHALIRVRTRLPEPPRRVDLGRIADADVVSGTSLAKGIAIGVAVGAGSTLGFLALLAAMLAD